MKRPAWLQNDLKVIATWWSTRFIVMSALIQVVTYWASFTASVWTFRAVFGRYGSLISFALGLAAGLCQFYRQRKKESHVTQVTVP